MTNTNTGGGCCGDIWDCNGSNAQQAKAAANPKFSLTSPLGPCVPNATLNSLPEFLKWFSTFATPLICQMSDLKTTECSVITGVDGKLVVKSISQIMEDCAGADCDAFRKKFYGATSCIPELVNEKATEVLSVDPVSGIVAWRSIAGGGDCAALTAQLSIDGSGCYPDKSAETAQLVLSADPSDGTLAWRTPPAFGCDLLQQFLTPYPDSAIGCFPASAVAATRLFGVLPDGSLAWVLPPAGGGGAAVVDCASVKTALEGTCVPDGVIVKELGYNAAGGLIKQPRRRLIRMSYESIDGTSDTYTDTIANQGNSANRRVYKWMDADTTNPFLSAGQYTGDMTFDQALNSITIGHSAVYQLSANVFARIKSASTTVGTSVSLLAGWYLSRPGQPAAELRFGEITQDLGRSDAVRAPSNDYVFTGFLQAYLPAGTIVKVRVWAGGGNAPSPGETVSIILDYKSPKSRWSIAELSDYE
jgi:hypothetical protein